MFDGLMEGLGFRFRRSPLRCRGSYDLPRTVASTPSSPGRAKPTTATLSTPSPIRGWKRVASPKMDTPSDICYHLAPVAGYAEFNAGDTDEFWPQGRR
ncbi:MAG: hypothetical protein ACLTKG_06820 [Collinsella intestinalis]